MSERVKYVLVCMAVGGIAIGITGILGGILYITVQDIGVFGAVAYWIGIPVGCFIVGRTIIGLLFEAEADSDA